VSVTMSLANACGISNPSLKAGLETTVMQFCELSASVAIAAALDTSACPARRTSNSVSSTVEISGIDQSTATYVSSLFSSMASGNSTLLDSFLSNLKSIGGGSFDSITGVTVQSVSINSPSSSSSSGLPDWAIAVIVLAVVLCVALVLFVLWTVQRHSTPHNRNYEPRPDPLKIPSPAVKDGQVTYHTNDGLAYSMASETASPLADPEEQKIPTMGPVAPVPQKAPEPVDHLVRI